jgi:hypothetical protein
MCGGGVLMVRSPTWLLLVSCMPKPSTNKWVEAATCMCSKHLIAATYYQKLKWNDQAPQACNQAGVLLCCQISHGAVLIVLSQIMLVQQAYNLWWCCPRGALTNNVVACVMHAETKGLLIFFGCSVESCHFNVLLVLLLPNLAGVRHAKAKGILVLFGCSVGSCHACPCSKHVIYDGVILMVFSQIMLLHVSCMLRPKTCWFSLDAVLSRSLQTCKTKQLSCSADNCSAKPIIVLSSLCSTKKILLLVYIYCLSCCSSSWMYMGFSSLYKHVVASASSHHTFIYPYVVFLTWYQ